MDEHKGPTPQGKKPHFNEDEKEESKNRGERQNVFGSHLKLSRARPIWGTKVPHSYAPVEKKMGYGKF